MKLAHLCLCLILLSVSLVGCGFTPIYSDKGEGGVQVRESLNSVEIANIPGEHGQFLRNKLIDRLYFDGRPKAPKAKLTIVLQTFEADSGIQKDATSTRSQLRATANFSLYDNKTKASLFAGQAVTVASYSKLDAQYGTLVTQRDAYRRAIKELSEQIVNRLSLYYAEKAPYIAEASAKK